MRPYKLVNLVTDKTLTFGYLWHKALQNTSKYYSHKIISLKNYTQIEKYVLKFWVVVSLFQDEKAAPLVERVILVLKAATNSRT